MSFSATNPFPLPELPPTIDFEDKDILKALIGANAAIAVINGTTTHHPNPMLLISPAVLRESVASSNIENINTTLADVLQNELFPEPERRAPDKEVLRYRDALMASFKAIRSRKTPIATRLIQDIQKTLVPGSNGDYRRLQNRIANDLTGEVLYTPPLPPDVPALMGNLEKFINADGKQMHPLVRIAISHYQFEAIHPFEDGNGRTGRIMMVLQLHEYGLLYHPILYISAYINSHRSDYYRLLRAVSAENKWKEFILFMLNGFEWQANETQTGLLKMSLLFEKTKSLVKEKCRRIYTIELIESAFSHPVLTPVKLGELLGVHYTTASKYLLELEKIGFLKGKKHGRYHFFANHALMALLKK